MIKYCCDWIHCSIAILRSYIVDWLKILNWFEIQSFRINNALLKNFIFKSTVIRYFQFLSRNFQMQTVRLFENENQSLKFYSKLKINSLQNFAIEIVSIHQNQFVIYSNNASIFYQNNQSMNLKFHQRFSEFNAYDCFLSNKRIYRYRNNHIYKRVCLNFNDNFFNDRIHIYEKIIFFEIFSWKNVLNTNVNWSQSAWMCEKMRKISWHLFFFLNFLHFWFSKHTFCSEN